MGTEENKHLARRARTVALAVAARRHFRRRAALAAATARAMALLQPKGAALDYKAPARFLKRQIA